MFGFGKVPCVLCDRKVTRREAVRLLGRKDTAICQSCLTAWERNGRTCQGCATAVRGNQEVGVFLRGHRGFGHADCGADRLRAHH